MWLDFVLAGLVLAIALRLLYVIIFPHTSHPVWAFIGAVVFFPTGLAFLTSGIFMHRGGPWRWWAQILPFAVVGGFLAYCGWSC